MNQAARFNFGFASNMVLLLWCVCGGFLLHMLEANYLTMLVKPYYEKPVDTAQDVIDKGLTVIAYPGYGQLMIDMILIHCMYWKNEVIKIWTREIEI